MNTSFSFDRWAAPATRFTVESIVSRPAVCVEDSRVNMARSQAGAVDPSATRQTLFALSHTAECANPATSGDRVAIDFVESGESPKSLEGQPQVGATMRSDRYSGPTAAPAR